jgi:transcriptional regulator with XRE-family HTH domain
MTRKSPNPIDIHVGSRVRVRRVLVGLSQEKLGEALELTFQQVQKYEKGTNRISASRLHKISQILEVPVQFFFEGVPETEHANSFGFSESSSKLPIMDFLNSAEGLQLNKAFAEIHSPAVRRKIVELVKALASEGLPGDGF